jgi:hypothetical protein
MRAGAVELWNGFTTEMNRNQVAARVGSLFVVKELTEYEGRSAQFAIFDSSSSDRLNMNDFPVTELQLRYSLSESSPYDFISFYFSSGRLFAVEFRTRAYVDDFLPVARSQYGQPTNTILETCRGQANNSFDRPRRTNFYVWLLPGRVVVSHDQTIYQTAPQLRLNGWLAIYDRQAVDNMYKERERAAAKRREEAASNIQF